MAIYWKSNLQSELAYNLFSGPNERYNLVTVCKILNIKSRSTNRISCFANADHFGNS